MQRHFKEIIEVTFSPDIDFVFTTKPGVGLTVIEAASAMPIDPATPASPVTRPMTACLPLSTLKL